MKQLTAKTRRPVPTSKRASTRFILVVAVITMGATRAASAQWPPKSLQNLKVLQQDISIRALTDTMAFMFETRFVLRPTRFALETPALQRDYDLVWAGLKRLFKG